MDGLTQQTRKERIQNTRRFDVIDNSMQSLLEQTEAIARFIRYYNLQGKEAGYFSQFLDQLRQIYRQGIQNHLPDGNMEPAQALLLTFLQQLHNITETFNRKWDNYIYHYLMETLGIQYLVPCNHKVCLTFTKNTPEPVYLPKNLKLAPTGDYPDVPDYHLCEDFIIQNTTVEKIFYIFGSKNGSPLVENGEPKVDSENIRNSPLNLGFIIASPSLLLKEGKRKVVITLTAENSPSQEDSRTFENIFYINISVQDGWKEIPARCYSFHKEENDYILTFTLPEEFPETTICNVQTHEISTQAPAIRIYLNQDAWQNPYPWLAQLRFNRMQIDCCVEGIKNIHIYNELGEADTSKPFAPFGINTEKGSSFIIGNYETAQKNTRHIDLVIDWNNLPNCTGGMKEYYNAYKQPIDNTTFNVQAACLAENQWKEAGEYPLFGTAPDAPLKKQTIIQNIPVEKTTPITLSEEEYNYTIDSRDGFLKLTLQSPETGFGEKAYRNLFSEYYYEKVFSQKKGISTIPNEPYKPIIERVRLNYTSRETIDFRKYTRTSVTTLSQITPFGYRQEYPGVKQHLIKLLFTIDAEANVLIRLQNATKGSALNLYFDFQPLHKEISLDEIPQIKWYIGDGYRWQNIPDGNLLQDKTKNLMQSGILKLILPADINPALFDEEGMIWLRAGVKKNNRSIPSLNKLYTNVVEAESDTKGLYDKRSLAEAPWKTLETLSGIDTITTVESYHSRRNETREMCLMRISEYTSHREKAVTPRDYERITLQAFPHIAKVKCLSAQHARNSKKATVTLAVIPKQPEAITPGGKQVPRLATSRQILGIEEYFKNKTSAYVNKVDVINPLYEKVIVRCRITFPDTLPAAWCSSRLANLLDELIAPWQAKNELPLFDFTLNISSIKQKIMEQEYITAVEHLSFIIISEKADRHCQLHEYGMEDNILRPSVPYAIFIPAKEHLINFDSENTPFGINEMTIDESFII